MRDRRARKGEGGGVDLLPSRSGPVVRFADEPEPATSSASNASRARVATVIIAIADEGLHQEILDFIGRHPGIDIAGSTADPTALPRLIDAEPSAGLILGPGFADQLAFLDRRGPVFVVAQELTVPILRTAVRAGARGVFQWPEEREDLAAATSAAETGRPISATTRGSVIAVAGARGGVGATFVATHLAGALAARGRRTVLVDADPAHADLTAALGIVPADGLRSIVDLLPVLDELSPDHLQDVLSPHPGGFAVLLGPGEPNEAVRPGVYRGVAALLALEYDAVILHVARAAEPSVRDVIAVADGVVLVTTLDVMSIYGARRVMATFAADGVSRPWFPVINRAGRSTLTPKDVERALGLRPAARIRSDARVRRAQERGRLLPATSRGAGRDVRRLAALIMKESAPAGNGRGA